MAEKSHAVDPEDYKLYSRNNDIRRKIEFRSELIRDKGKSRDIGILYGICTALMIVVVYLPCFFTCASKITVIPAERVI
jgi:tetrahydromethanopterin S-methyltransferase subunit G